MTPQQEQQRQQDALNEWEREDAIRKTTMKTLLLFLWTNRHALAALIIKTLEAKLKEDEQPQGELVSEWDEILRQSHTIAGGSSVGVGGLVEPVTLTSDELTQRGPMVSIPTVHDTASAILEAKK